MTTGSIKAQNFSPDSGVRKVSELRKMLNLNVGGTRIVWPEGDCEEDRKER